MNTIDVRSMISHISKPNFCEGDYYSADGLLYCGKCHTPKQMRGEGPTEGMFLSIVCRCRQAEMEKEAEAEQRARVEELRLHCLPEEEKRNHRFSIADDDKNIRIAKKYCDEWEQVKAKNIGLVLWGNTGSGKSFTVDCICNALIDQAVPVINITTVELVSKLADRNTDREVFIKRLREIPLLVLDDLGAERDTEFSHEQLCSVIDTRAEGGRPLVITTNYTLDEMKNVKDRRLLRIFNRVFACCIPVNVSGKSKRDALAEEKLAFGLEMFDV